MLAYSAQDLILEPFAGVVFGLTLGETTQLASVQHGGVFAGMMLVALVAGRWVGSLRAWTVGGCMASAVALFALCRLGFAGPGWPLGASYVALGVANGAFAVAAIASMMQFAGQGRGGREGMRMGLWGAAQAIAFGLGGLVGAVASDVARSLIATPAGAYGLVFMAEGIAFLAAAMLAARIGRAPAPRMARGNFAVSRN